ncbi:uncharacterized protein LOC135148492 [Daucus carota subsp. sativus]|uniref:uncharacterized protein LOC135148492 n=1 Tax=Daucus carota subsp. sativus TaxID=79200 RepID=UPI00308317C5
MDLEVVKVIKQCVSEGADANYIRKNILPGFIHNFWTPFIASNPDSYKHIVETTLELANKVGAAEILERIVEGLEDESETYRRMAVETIGKVVDEFGASDIDVPLERLLVYGILSAFIEQDSEDDADVMLNGFCVWCLSDKRAVVRKQGAEAVSRILVVLKECEEERLMGYLGVVLFECCFLREESHEVLASMLGALKAIGNSIDLTSVIPSFRDLVTRLTPLMESRYENENVQDLIADVRDLSFSEQKHKI